MTSQGVSPANRSLERGIELLRSFRPGSALLGNAELAERTGLSRSTVSRLTQTLVGGGLLQVEPRSRAFRLAPAVLSFGHAMRTGSSVLAIAAPCMRQAAEENKINVGLAAPDRDEMVYLESIRYNRRPSLRSVVSGQRVPMELTSLGRAYLASAPEAKRKALLAHFRQARRATWPDLGAEISLAIESVTAARLLRRFLATGGRRRGDSNFVPRDAICPERQPVHGRTFQGRRG